MDDLRQRIFEAGKALQLVNVATVGPDGRPYVRPVVGKLDEALNLRFSTHLDSRKIGQLRHNPHVHASLCHADAYRRGWLQIAGTARITTAEDERRAFWFDALQAYVSGVEDPRYSVVIVEPARIEVWRIDVPEPEVWQRAA